MHATERPMPFSHAGSHSFPSLPSILVGSWCLPNSRVPSRVLPMYSPLPLHLAPGFQPYGMRDGSFSKEGKKIPGPLLPKLSCTEPRGMCNFVYLSSQQLLLDLHTQLRWLVHSLLRTLRSRAESDEIRWGCVIGRFPSKDLAPGPVGTKSRRLVECKCSEVTPIHSLEKGPGCKKKRLMDWEEVETGRGGGGRVVGIPNSDLSDPPRICARFPVLFILYSIRRTNRTISVESTVNTGWTVGCPSWFRFDPWNSLSRQYSTEYGVYT